MRGLSAKLHSTRGASMLMALFFLLVCVTAGAVMLTAATASAAKEQNRYQEQQAYLAVSSAARLLKKQLGSSSYVVTAVPYDTGEADADGNEIWSYRLETTLSPAGGNLLTKNIDEKGNVSNSASGSYTVTAHGADAPENALTVEAEYAMDARSRKATFTLTDAKTRRYSMTLTFSAAVTPPDALGQFSIYWDGGVIEKGGSSHA